MNSIKTAKETCESVISNDERVRLSVKTPCKNICIKREKVERVFSYKTQLLVIIFNEVNMRLTFKHPQ